MLLGVSWTASSACYYRAIDPMRAMERLGHEVVWPDDDDGRPDLRRLAGCDVVHVFRRHDPETQALLQRLAASGTAIVWDTDDDLSAIPKESPLYKKTGGLRARATHRETIKTARLADIVTATTVPLAERYAKSGIANVEVIENVVAKRSFHKRRRHDGVVVGWVAGMEHLADTAAIPIADTLRRLLTRHHDLHVHCVGVDLGLPQRYHHEPFVPFAKLPERVAEFDIGIAPLADIPFNRTRSSIKLKEYGACGVPWVASPVGPYAGLGDEQGGHLVDHDKWYDALEELIQSRRLRRRLGRKAKTWAKHERIETTAQHWEAVFSKAVARAEDRRQTRSFQGRAQAVR